MTTPTATRQTEQRILIDIPVDWLDPSPHNPRSGLGDLEALAELTDSVKERGIVEPIIAVPNGDRYTIVCGHRRHAAARNAGLLWVPCVLDERDADALDLAADALVENVQRESLNHMEEARAYAHLRTLDPALTQKDLANLVGRSEAHVSKHLSLLVLPDVAQEAVATGRLPVATALGLTGLAKHPEHLAELDKDLDAIADPQTSDQDRALLRKRLESSIAHRLQAIDVETKTERLRQELTDMGIDVVDWPPGGYFTPKSKWRFCERGEHGEATTIDPTGKARDITKAPPAKKPTTKAAPAKATSAKRTPTPGQQLELEASRAAEAERKATEVRRDAVIRKLVNDATKRAMPPTFADHTLTQIVEAELEDNCLYSEAELVCEWLDLTVEPSGNMWAARRAALAALARTDIKAVRRVAFALALSHVESIIRDEAVADWQNPIVQRHYTFLKDHGYEPSPYEAEHLAGSTTTT